MKKPSDKELIGRNFYGERFISALRVFRAIKRAKYVNGEELEKKLKLTQAEVEDVTTSLRRAGFIVSSGGHQVSSSYKNGNL